MAVEPIVATLVLAFLIPIALVPFVVFILIVRMLLGRSRKEPGITAEEVRLMQEIHRGLSKMDQRIESLETLMLDSEGARKTSSGRNTP